MRSSSLRTAGSRKAGPSERRVRTIREMTSTLVRMRCTNITPPKSQRQAPIS
jgi:hypothetical protein